MREICTSGSEGGVAQTNAPSLPLSVPSPTCLLANAPSAVIRRPMSVSAKLDPALLRECHARARGWAGLFRLPLRQRVWRGGSGDFMGRGTGSSLDFQDHRAYAPGDDPRHINWQAYARTGPYSMKLFREEVRPLIDIVLDVSPSMLFTPEKVTRVIELFYFAVEGAMRAGTAPAVTAVSGGWHRTLPRESVMGHRWGNELPNGP